MNFKIVLAAVVLISGGSYASHAQKTSTVIKSAVSAAKSFENKIAAYEKETNATKATALLGGLKQDMMSGISSAKVDVNTETNKGNTAGAATMMKKYDSRAQSLNSVIKSASDKAAVLVALKQYAKTL